jgi:acetyl esterase/lipase
MKKLFLLVYFLSAQIILMAQTEIPLYPNGIPNSKPSEMKEGTEKTDNRILISGITIPTLTVFLPPKGKGNGAAMIICPGGGYVREAIGHEGYDVARRLSDAGVTCFVLKYRLPDDSIMQDKTIGPLQDAQRAVQFVRENRKQWDVNKNRIGIMGFSAGGHLASTEGTHFEKALIPNPKGTSLRPDFMVLVYPVINLSDSLMHEGSRTRLLGKNPSQDMIRNYSNDLQVNRKTPPTFLVHAKDDKTVKVENSIRFYDALQRNKVPSMIYLFEKGGHGFGLKNPTSNIEWLDLVLSWMRSSGWMGDKYQQ